MKITGQKHQGFEISPLTLALKISTLDMTAPQEDCGSFEISNEELEEAWAVILLSVMHRALSLFTLIGE